MTFPRVTQLDYPSALVTVSRAALNDLARRLQSYREALVLIGGWVPRLLLEKHQRPDVKFRHVGSVDVDFLVDPAASADRGAPPLARLLEEADFQPSGVMPGRFFRRVPHQRDPIHVDFVMPAGEEARIIDALGFRPGPLPDVDVGLRHACRWDLASGIQVRMADLAGVLALKSIAMRNREDPDPKDDYDVWTLCRYYGTGPREVGRLVRPAVADPAVRRELEALGERFASRTSIGAQRVAEFLSDDLPGDVMDPRTAAVVDIRLMLEAAGVAS